MQWRAHSQRTSGREVAQAVAVDTGPAERRLALARDARDQLAEEPAHERGAVAELAGLLAGALARGARHNLPPQLSDGAQLRARVLGRLLLRAETPRHVQRQPRQQRRRKGGGREGGREGHSRTALARTMSGRRGAKERDLSDIAGLGDTVRITGSTREAGRCHVHADILSSRTDLLKNISEQKRKRC